MSQIVSSGIRAIKSARRLVPTKSAITITPPATERLKELLAKNPTAIGLRIGVKTRGCNGLSYTLEYVNEKKKFDEMVQHNGVNVYIGSKAQLTLLGTEMDYVKTDLSSEFVFHNPNIKGTCGCGESFQI